MVLSTESDMEIQKDLLTSWAISPIKVETQVLPTSRLVVKLASPLTPSDQAEEERRCVLIVTVSMGRLNLEATGVTIGDIVTASVGRVAFKNPQMAVVLPEPTKKEESGWPPGHHHRGTGRKGFGGRPPIEDITDLS